MDPKKLTFEQREGVEPLPTQLALRVVTPAMRALLWNVFFEVIDRNKKPIDNYRRINGWLKEVLLAFWIRRAHRMPDNFNDKFTETVPWVKDIFVNGNYTQIFGFVEFVIRHPSCPVSLPPKIDEALLEVKSAYRIVDGDTVTPVASDEEAAAIGAAFKSLSLTELSGSRVHLKKAAEELAAGNWASSIRESVHAVEAVARTLEPTSNTLDPALAKLAKAGHIHSALRQGFGKLYGFSNDEEGIRHPLLEKQAAAVDETDAIYMFGACASFVSYLIGKGRAADLL